MSYQSFPIFWGNPPDTSNNIRVGSRYFPFTADFSVAPYAYNTYSIQYFSFSIADIGLQSVRGILIDNSLNPRSVEVTIQDTGQIIQCPPLMQYRGPVLTGGVSFNASVGTGGGTPVKISLFNIELQEARWKSYNPAAGLGSLPIYAPVSRFLNLTSAGGQKVILPANQGRYGFSVYWDGNSTGNLILSWGDQNGNLANYLTQMSPGSTYEMFQSSEYPQLPRTNLYATSTDATSRTAYSYEYIT